MIHLIPICELHHLFHEVVLHHVQYISSGLEYPVKVVIHLLIIHKKPLHIFLTVSVFRTISLYFSDVFKNSGSLMLSIVKYCWYFANTLSNIMYDIINV